VDEIDSKRKDLLPEWRYEVMKINKMVARVVLTAYVGSLGLSGIANACTLLGASGSATKDGNVYLASTSDNPYIEGPRKPVYVTIPKNGYKFVHTPCLIQSPPGHYFDVGSDRGMNEKGFSWTRSWVVPNEKQAANAVPAVEWFLKMGSTVATVDEAIKFVKDHPKGIGTQGNYIFADAQGNLAVVEVGYETVTVAERWSKGDKGMAARANRWESPKMKSIDASEKENNRYYVTSEYRQPRAMELMKKASGKIDVDAMKRFLADNSNRELNAPGYHGRSIASHGSSDGTVSAEVYDPANRTFWYTYGWPDGDVKSSNPSIDGANKNTWGTWLPFVVSELTEEGYYTDWNGNITPMGARYFARLAAKS
jgi:hypothetical protein